MIVKCIRRCWDGKRARRYYPGDQDDIQPGDAVAKYFDFPEEAKAPPAPPPEADDGPTKKEIMEELTALNVAFNAKDTKPVLQALLDKAKAEGAGPPAGEG